MNTKGWLLLAFFYVLLPLAQSVMYMNTYVANGGPFATSLDPLQAFNFLSSIVSYHWLLANVLLSLKLPVLQNALPYDLRIRFHVWSTLAVTFLLLWHGVYTIFLNPQTIDLFSWVPLPLFLVLMLLAALWVPLPGLRKLVLAKAYDVLKTGHKLAFLLLAGFSWWHVADRGLSILDPNRSHNVDPVSAWAYQLLFLVTVALYLASLVREALLPVLEVESVTRAGGILRLSLKKNPALRYRGGQFAFLRVLLPGLRREEHPFSYTSGEGDRVVSFAIRELGDYTSRLQAVKPGDLVKVNGSFGGFFPGFSGETRHARPLALIGSGIGNAPLISILKDLAHRDPLRETVLFQAVTKREELLEPERVAELLRLMPRLKLRTLVYEEDGLLYTPELLANELEDPSRYQVYLCSSERVRKPVVKALLQRGVRRRNIVFEAFNLG